MKILTRSTNVIYKSFGFFEALINYKGSRKVYKVIIQDGTNEVIKVLKEYKSKKEAFLMNNVIY